MRICPTYSASEFGLTPRYIMRTQTQADIGAHEPRGTPITWINHNNRMELRCDKRDKNANEIAHVHEGKPHLASAIDVQQQHRITCAMNLLRFASHIKSDGENMLKTDSERTPWHQVRMASPMPMPEPHLLNVFNFCRTANDASSSHSRLRGKILNISTTGIG